jgi:hypothetical protein
MYKRRKRAQVLQDGVDMAASCDNENTNPEYYIQVDISAEPKKIDKE